MRSRVRNHHWLAAAAALSTITVLSACAPSAAQDDRQPAADSGSATSAEASPSGPASSPDDAGSETPASAAPTTSGPDGSATPSAEEGACTAAMLSGEITTQPGSGSAGSVYRTLELTNTSAEACEMKGFPGVSYVDAAGKQIGAPADREEGTVSSFALEPDATATAVLRQTNAGKFGPDCNITAASGVRVYPPGATDSLVLEQQSEACAATSVVLMGVGPMQPVG